MAPPSALRGFPSRRFEKGTTKVRQPSEARRTGAQNAASKHTGDGPKPVAGAWRHIF